MIISKEAEIRHNQIDSAFKMSMATIEERRLAIEISMQAVCKELDQSHMESSKIVESISKMNLARKKEMKKCVEKIKGTWLKMTLAGIKWRFRIIYFACQNK